MPSFSVQRTLPIGALALAAATGALLVVSPILAALLAASALLALLLANAERLDGIFHAALLLALLGYATLDRTFAYVGFAPLYVGELMLLLAAVVVLTHLGTFRLGLPEVLIIAFMALGALRTLPFLGTYGIEALRDGVIWAYAAFALAVSAAGRRLLVERALSGYARFLPLWVWAMPGLLALSLAFRNQLPTLPGSDVNILFLRPTGVSVHLAGVAAFILFGLHNSSRKHPVREVLLWIPWLATLALTATYTRGGTLALAASLVCVAVIQVTSIQGTQALTRALRLAAVGSVLLVAFLLAAPALNVHPGRSVSPGQIADNFVSVFSSRESVDPILEGTKNWRLEWWGSIVDYTFRGPYFWGGKGFGVNLADDDGFQVDLVGHSLRSPHNSHMTILARMGVPGLALWVLLHVTFVVQLVRTMASARRSARPRLALAAGWVLAYWAAMMVDTSFELYLEGPQGGIWLWSILGLGLAIIAVGREPADRPDLT